LIEAKTYRYREHAELGGLNIGSYRSDDEIAEWKARDPVPAFRAMLVAEGVLSEPAADGLEHEVRAEVDAAVSFAETSSYPASEEAFTHLYTSAIPAP
jgi:pyruvate dehydrogenase E1 component alpha subunit